MAELLVEARGLTVTLAGRERVTRVDLTLPAGRTLAVVGPNGAGKSTLLRVIAGDIPFAGELRVRGIDPRQSNAAEMARGRAFLEQAPTCAWPLTAREVVALGDPSRADAALARLGLERLVDRSILTLSGGEQRLVHLARCLAQLGDPAGKLLLLDEPTASLDHAHALRARDLATSLAREGAGVVLATHDLGHAANCDLVLAMAAGRPVAVGRPDEVLRPEVTRPAWGFDVSLSRDADGRVAVTTRD